MSNQNTTFHAKITADARQFIEQVEGASQSLKQLVDTYGQVSKQAKTGATKSASNATEKTQKEVKDIFSVAKKEQSTLHQAAMQNEQEIAALRSRTSKVNDSDAFGEAGARARARVEARAEAMRQKAMDDQRKDHRTYSDQVFDSINKSTAAQRISDQQEQARLKERFIEQDKMNKAHRSAILENRRIDEQGARQAARDNRTQMDAMVTGRYALFDMANAYRGVLDVSKQVTQQLLSVVRLAAEFESSFTAVERALKLESGSQPFLELRESLVQLSTEIPVAFGELSEIAALGGQMGIANEDIEQFTKTVAMFTATTAVSVEEAATKFGRISSLLKVPVNEFENLASAITFAGFNAVATESEILTMTQSIAANAAKAGFAADETVGLATALASLALAPELSRGALQRIFGQFDQAVAGTSGTLDDLARVMNTTEDQIAFLWKEDPSRFFYELNQGLSETEELSSALRSIGIINIRDVELVTRLAQNMDVYNKALEDSTGSYDEGTALASFFASSLDDLDSSFKRVGNAFAGLLQALGGGFAEGLKPLLEGVIAIIDSLRRFAETPLAQIIVPITAALTAAIGAFAAFNFIVNIATAQVLAMRTAQLKMSQMTGTSSLGLKALYNQLAGNVYIVTQATGQVQFFTKAQIEAQVAAGGLTRALADQAIAAGTVGAATRGLSIAMRALGFATAIFAVVSIAAVALDASGAMDLFSDKTKKAAEEMREIGQAGIAAAGGFNALQDAIERDTETAKAASLGKLKDAQGKVNTALEQGIDLHSQYAGMVGPSSNADLAQAKVKGEEYRTLLAESLLDVPSGGGASFVSKFLEVDGDTNKILTRIGFDYVDMIDAALADGADGQGAQKYVAAFQEAFRLLEGGAIVGTTGFSFAQTIGESLIAQFGPEIGQPLAEEIRKLGRELGQQGVSMKELAGLVEEVDFSAFIAGAQAVDATNTEVDRQIRAQEDLAGRLPITTDEIDAQQDAYEELNKQMKEYIGLVGILPSENQKVSAAFGQLAAGVKDTEAGFTGLGEAAAKNLSNLKSFISAAFSAGFAEGDGPLGGLERLSAAIVFLGQQGSDTSELWDLARNLFVNSLTLMGGQYAVLGRQLSVAPDFKAAQIIVSGFISAADAAGQLTPVLVANINALRKAMEGESNFANDFQAAFDAAMRKVQRSSARTVTALERLQNTLKETFRVTSQRIELNDSLRTLGETLRENGKTFSVWSKAGTGNVKALLSTIDELAKRSGGDSKKFANDLVSLRQALVGLGVGSSGLRYVDAALRRVGVAGKSSANDVSRFADALSGVGETVSGIESVADAINKVAGAATSGLKYRFSQAFAVDEITLGWLAMEDAAANAASQVERFGEQMEKARENIEKAKLAIDRANASIQKLTADKGKLEYQLSVALRYGDTLRAEQIRADMASIDANIATENERVAESNRRIAGGNSDIAKAEQGIVDVRTQTARKTIQANRALEQMAEKYAQATAHMLVNAEEGEDLNKIIEDQVEAFKNNAIQMGHTEERAQAVADILREELIKSMEEIPDNIETLIKAETSGALSAVNNFVRDANNRLAKIDRNIVITTSYVGQNTPASRSSGGGPAFAYLASGGLVSGPGSSTSDSIAARLSDGEYVVRASAVEQYGVPFLNALNQQRVNPAMMSAPASSLVAGGGVMSLSPEDRALLRAALDRPVNLYTDNTVIAKSANDGNKLLAQRGLK